MTNELLEQINRMKAGDMDAVGVIYKEYKDQIYYYVKQYIKNEHDIEDIVHSAFMSVFTSIKSLKEAENFRAWMMRIVHNKVMDCFRRNKKYPTITETNNDDLLGEIEEDNSEFLPGDIMESEETMAFVARLVRELPEEQKTAVLLYYYKGLKLNEIAEIQGCKENTVKTRLFYARRSIRSKIEDDRKRGYEVTALLPFPILTKVLYDEAAKNTLSSSASIQIWGNIQRSIMTGEAVSVTEGIANKKMVNISKTTTVLFKVAGTSITVKMLSVAIGIMLTITIATTIIVLQMDEKESGVNDNTGIIMESGASDNTYIIMEGVGESVIDIMALIDPETKSDYAKLYYYLFVHNVPKKHETEHMIFELADAEIIDFWGTGEYALVTLGKSTYTESGYVDYSINIYLKNDVVNSVINNAVTTNSIYLSIRVHGNRFYVGKHNERQALIFDSFSNGFIWTDICYYDDGYDLQIKRVRKIGQYGGAYGITNLKLEIENTMVTATEDINGYVIGDEANSAMRDRIKVQGTFGAEQDNQTDLTGLEEYFLIDFKETQGERLRDYFEE